MEKPLAFTVGPVNYQIGFTAKNYCIRLAVEQKSSYFPITDVHFLMFKSQDW